MFPRQAFFSIALLSSPLLLPAAAAAGAKSLPAAAAPAVKNSFSPAIRAALEKGDYHAVQAEITRELKDMQDISPANTPALRLAMALELIRETSPEVMASFATDKAKRQFLTAFMEDAAWQELYLGCGLVPHHTDVGLKVLFDIWMSEKGKVANKPLAVALASVWGGGETAPSPNIQRKNPARYNPLWRYRFFQKQAAKGLLHPNYKNLQPWELRFVVGIPGQDWDDGSYSWAAEHINLPWDQYINACWAAIYTDPSRFGDDVQSGEYNLPYADISWGEATQLSGGVCGALSHLGCVAAMAHGIPAYTVEQPGHCAYGVRTERGKWVGGFGGPDGGMHNHIFGQDAPTSYLLMEAVFADDAAIARAYRHSFCARAREAAGDAAGALAEWQAALAESPLHPFFRKQLHRLMEGSGLDAQGAFDYLMKTLPLYKGNGFAAVAMAKDFDALLAGMDDTQKAAVFAEEHKAISSTPSTWAIKPAAMLQAQSDALGADEARLSFLSDTLTAHLNAGDGTMFGHVLEWAVDTYVKQGKEDIFSKAFAAAAAAAPAVDSNDKDKGRTMREAYGKAIVASEQARSAPAFQALTEAAAKALGEEKSTYTVSQPANIKGEATPAAMFRISTSSQWDSPVRHLAIATPQGGHCHTSQEEKPHFIVELPDSRTLTGCVVRKADGFEGRMKKATVYTSEDGATWKPRAEIADMPKEWAVPFPEGTQGKWVKVEFDHSGTPGFAHISHFVIYSK